MQLLVFLSLLLVAVKPLGLYMAWVYQGKLKFLAVIERPMYRLCGVRPEQGMGWRPYATGLLIFNFLGLVLVYGILRCQSWLPWNPQGFPDVSPDLALNTAVSFASNTNWQSYGGETTMSNGSQMLALTVQNFLSAATGMAVLVALIRGLIGRTIATIGNVWVDLVRSTLYVLLPLSIALALALVSQGVVQTLQGSTEVELTQTLTGPDGLPIDKQTIALGPVASQVAIKQLGTNGGGFYNVNSAHPLENPTPLSNLLQMLAILLIPAALCMTFGEMVGDRRQGWAIFAAMALVFVPLCVAEIAVEQVAQPTYAALNVDQTFGDTQSGGNMEGKETRFGVVDSALWAVTTTAASNGSVNAMHDSFTPLGGMIPMWLMQLGEVIFGGVGSGLYGMLVFAIIAVFVAGLMVGRTPEYLGKKIEAAEMKLAALVILIPPLMVLIGTAVSVIGPGLDYVAADTGELKSNLNNPARMGSAKSCMPGLRPGTTTAARSRV
ncbi:MAG: potassium-transporting ATPase subunit KdpA [Pirellulales bacterium]